MPLRFLPFFKETNYIKKKTCLKFSNFYLVEIYHGFNICKLLLRIINSLKNYVYNTCRLFRCTQLYMHNSKMITFGYRIDVMKL